MRRSRAWLGILRDKGEQPHSLSRADAGGTQARACEDPAQPGLQGTRGDRAPAGLPRLRRCEAVRRPRRWRSERRFLGLFTHTAYSASPWEIPLLRRKVQNVLERSGLPPGSHDHKAMIEILETYPRDELFQITEDELLEIALGILHLGERRRVRLFVRRDVFGRFLSCLVFIPRERFNTENRRKIQEILQEAFGGVSTDYIDPHLRVGARPASFRRLHRARLGARLRRGGDRGASAAATRAWTDDLRDALADHTDDKRAGELHERYAESFPRRLPRRLAAPGRPRPRPDRTAGVGGRPRPQPLRSARLDCRPARVQGRPRRPADPTLGRAAAREHGRVGVSDERLRAAAARRDPVWIYDFGLQHDFGAELRVEELRETFQHVRAGLARRGRERRLQPARTAARLTAREITILRAIAKYLRQAGSTFSQAYMEDALTDHPDVAVARAGRALRAPARPGPPGRCGRAGATVEDRLAGIVDGVASLDEDRSCAASSRRSEPCRTNYFQVDQEGRAKPYLSLTDPADPGAAGAAAPL